MAVNTAAFGVAAGLTFVFVVLHYARGGGWEPTADISQEVLERRAEAVPETDFPEPMNRSIGGGGGAVAVGAGAEEGAELEEGAEEEEGTSPADIPEDEVEYFEVEFVKEGETVEVPNNQTLLESGEEEGWDMPYACRQGQCVSCSAKIPDGPAEDFVVHDNQEMFSEAEMEEGYTLTCVAYPRDDFSLETSESP